jgi:hypothetical protein
MALAILLIAIGIWKVAHHHSHPARSLIVGVDDDTLKWTAFPLTVVHRQQSLGANAVRVWVPWRGEIAPTAVRRDELARAETAARKTTVVLAVFGFGAQTPTAVWQQTRFCGYAKAALALVPDARAVVVWNEANAPTYWRGTPAQYESLLARCYDELHSQRVQVLDSTASAHNPVAFLRALASAYRSSGRTQPIVDAFGHNPYPLTPTELPTVTHTGDFLGEADYPRLVSTLEAFGRTPSIWYLEDGFQTTKITPEQQARSVADAVAMAACQPLVQAFFNFELVDETRAAGWHSGLIWRGGRVKPAAAAFAGAPRRCRT